MLQRPLHPRSLAAQAMGKIDRETKAVVPPIHVSTTYLRDEDNGYSTGFVYGRPDNETIREAESVLAMLEEAKAGALLFGSGMAAATAVFQALAPGDHVVASKVMYWALRSWLLTEATRWGLRVDFAETDDLAALQAAVKPGVTKLVWVETPTNPLLGIGDIEALAAVAHDAGALLVVDNTFASPYLQQPLALGADVVVHSTTKYVGGHSDVVGGALVVRDDALADRIRFHQNAMGAVAGPFDAWLTLRGLKTLAVRMDRHCDNAERIVAHLLEHPAVEQVIYPGLTDHPGHEVAARQMKRFGGMVSFRVKGGEAAALAVCERTHVFTLGESLGGVESLIEHPGRMTHASVAGTDLEVPADLVRLSVGIESVDDLVADLDQALSSALSH